MVDAAAAAFFGAQRQDPANRACLDCGTADPEWASVSHGVYLSIEAAGVHRSLGAGVSSVQSTSMDSWKPLHLRMMELGGNRRFREFLEAQGVPEEMPIRQKYSTRAAEWYRENLRALAEGAAPPPPLPPGTGRLPACAEPSPEQLLLDRVFAAAPRGNVMTPGGVHLDTARRGGGGSSITGRGGVASRIKGGVRTATRRAWRWGTPREAAAEPGVAGELLRGGRGDGHGAEAAAQDVRRRPCRAEAQDAAESEDAAFWGQGPPRALGGGGLGAGGPAGFLPLGSTPSAGCGAPPLWCVAVTCVAPFCRRSCARRGKCEAH